jgi:hypothetical protein
MSLRLVPRVADPLHFAEHPISRLRLEPSRRTSATRSRRQPWPPAASEAEHEDPTHEALALDEPGSREPDAEQGRDDAPDHVPPPSPDNVPDYAAARAQAEAEDVALVRLAAARFAVALHEVAMLLRGAQGSRRSDALARCTAKGWVTLQGDPWAASQTFRVTPVGYRAAGLRAPPFVS